ncbi:MAG: diacylglycerol kinase family lipid kinase [Clostridium sp.]|nr:diacylglycerol kinase family lipid kinase [Clostridium sp.]
MENEKTLLIVNPRSGVNSKDGMGQALASELEAHGFAVTVAYTACPGHATELARRAVADGFGSVVVCGGDGTVNEAASGLIGSDVALGIVPSGSGNGLARHLGIPVDEKLSLEIIRKENVRLCDYGVVGGRNFFCTCGLGFDASVSHKFSHETRRGRISYIKSVVETFAGYKPQTFVLDIDGKRLRREAFLIAVCNASQYGNNAFIAPMASLSDGQLDVIVIKSGNALKMMLAGFDVLTGMVPYNHNIETFRVRRAAIDLPGPVLGHIDGEPVNFSGRLDFECRHNKLKVYGNPGKRRFRPFITPIDFTLKDWGIAINRLFGH